jgi:ribose transport system permease protein
MTPHNMTEAEMPSHSAQANSGAITPGAQSARRGRNWLARLSVRNIGAIYVLFAICVVFSSWVPRLFLTSATVEQVLDSNAITAMAALALIVPLSTRTFDLSFAYTMSLSGCVAAKFVVSDHMGVLAACLLGMAAALVIGVINGIVVVGMKIDSFIGTLATGSLVQAFITYFTNDNTINDPRLGGAFSTFGQNDIHAIVYPVFYALAIAIALWLFMGYTATGRRLYATGVNPDAARLANIRVDRLRFCSLLVSAVIAGFAGLCLASSLSAGSPTAGTAYLLPAFAAVFVGATQFKNGRFNAWGTVVAVLMLGTGTIGLGLASAPSWSADMFTGVVLLAALGATGLQRRSHRGGTVDGLAALRRRLRGTGTPT